VSSEKFIPKKGEIVLLRGQPGTFKVLFVSEGGRTADIQSFSLSSQELLGNIIKVTHCSELIPFQADASQADAQSRLTRKHRFW
jgi:hypothetical protein